MKINRLNRWCLGFLLLSFQHLVVAQVLTPVKWSNTSSVNQAKIGDVIELDFTAELDDTWYIYSSDQDPKVGPLPTVFTFEKDSSYDLVGDIMPVGVKEKYDDIWAGNVRTMKEKAEFRQKIKVLKAGLKVGVICEYQVCTTVNGKCIPGDEEFKFDNIKVIR